MKKKELIRILRRVKEIFDIDIREPRSHSAFVGLDFCKFDIVYSEVTEILNNYDKNKKTKGESDVKKGN